MWAPIVFSHCPVLLPRPLPWVLVACSFLCCAATSFGWSKAGRWRGARTRPLLVVPCGWKEFRSNHMSGREGITTCSTGWWWAAGGWGKYLFGYGSCNLTGFINSDLIVTCFVSTKKRGVELGVHTMVLFYPHTQILGVHSFSLVNFVITEVELACAKYLFVYVPPSCFQDYFLSCSKSVPAFLVLRFQKWVPCPLGTLLPVEHTGRAATCLATNRVFFK